MNNIRYLADTAIITENIEDLQVSKGIPQKLFGNCDEPECF